MTIRILERITDLDAAQWDALLPVHACPMIEHGYLAALEVSGSLAKERFEPRHLTLWSGDTLIAAAPSYLNHSERGDQLPDWARLVAQKHALPYDATLFIGIPLTWAMTPKFLTAPGTDRDASVAQLIAAAKQLVASHAVPVIHCYFSEEEELAMLERAGFMGRISPHYAWLNNGYSSFQDFLDQLLSKRRNAMKQERRRVAERNLSVRMVRGREVTSELMEVMWQFHGRTIEKHGSGADYYTRAYFHALHERLGDRLEICVAEQDGQPVAASLFLSSDQALYVRQWGASDDIPNLHFEVTWYQAIEEAIRRGLQRVDSAGGEDHKLLRGFIPVWMLHSATWTGDPDMAEAIQPLLDRERAHARALFESQRRRSPFRAP